MDLQVISPLAAAIGIPAALLVGRWQLRGALATARAGTRAAEETARAGIAQAEATYRAALDAVRAEAANAHSHWRRGLRRDAYTALLLASHQARTAGVLLTSGSIADRVSRGVFTAQRAALAEAQIATQEAALVVSIEGPDEAASKAEALAFHCQRFIDVRRQSADVDEASHSLRNARDGLSVDDPLSEFLAGVQALRAQMHGYSGSPEDLEAELNDSSSPSRIRDLRHATFSKLMEIPAALNKQGGTVFFAATRHPDEVREEWQETDMRFGEAHRDFLTTARTLLDADSTP